MYFAGQTLIAVGAFNNLTFFNKKDTIMSKGQDTKKGSKKEPAKSMKEKQAAKRDKKNSKGGQVIVPKK